MNKGCDSNQILTSKDVRTFIIHRSNDGICGWKERRTKCQFIESEGFGRNIRGSITDTYAFSMDGDEDCLVASIEDTPQTLEGTFRIREQCEAGKIPFPETLGRCTIYLITNVGPCEKGNGVFNWSGNQRVECVQLVQHRPGKLNSFNRTDQPIDHEFTARQVDRYTISTVYWSELNVQQDEAFCEPANLKFCEAQFGCRRGCGEERCGCKTPCDNGTGSIYAAGVCLGSNFQTLAYSVDGGQTFSTAAFPLPNIDTNGDGEPDTIPDVSECPKLCVQKNRLYMLGHMDPPVLFQADIDVNGQPEGFTIIAALGDSGTPAALCCEGDEVYALVNDAADGSCLYRYGFGSNVNEPLHTFPVDANVNGMSCCGETIYAWGDNGSAFVSNDGGISWNNLSVDSAVLNSTISSITDEGGYIKLATADGQLWYSVNDGLTWSQNPIGASAINDAVFSSGIGWIAAPGGAPYSTWVLGGLSNNWWTRSAPRNKGWPAGYEAQSIAMPECAEEWLRPNTALAVATDANGDSHIMIGRPQVA